jgi:hypothetical protein
MKKSFRAVLMLTVGIGLAFALAGSAAGQTPFKANTGSEFSAVTNGNKIDLTSNLSINGSSGIVLNSSPKANVFFGNNVTLDTSTNSTVMWGRRVALTNTSNADLGWVQDFSAADSQGLVTRYARGKMPGDASHYGKTNILVLRSDHAMHPYLFGAHVYDSSLSGSVWLRNSVVTNAWDDFVGFSDDSYIDLGSRVNNGGISTVLSVWESTIKLTDAWATIINATSGTDFRCGLYGGFIGSAYAGILRGDCKHFTAISYDSSEFTNTAFSFFGNILSVHGGHNNADFIGVTDADDDVSRKFSDNNHTFVGIMSGSDTVTGNNHTFITTIENTGDRNSSPVVNTTGAIVHDTGTPSGQLRIMTNGAGGFVVKQYGRAYGPDGTVDFSFDSNGIHGATSPATPPTGITNGSTAKLASATVTNLTLNPGGLLILKNGLEPLANGTYKPLSAVVIDASGNLVYYTNTTSGATNREGLGAYIAWQTNNLRWVVQDPGDNDVYYWGGSAWISTDSDNYEPPPSIAGTFSSLVLSSNIAFQRVSELDANTVHVNRRLSLGSTNLISTADSDLAATSIKINNTADSHVAFSSVASGRFINEAYFENQDGAGHRVGGDSFGLDTDGTAIIGSLKEFRFVNSSSPYPHTNLMTLDVTTAQLTAVGGFNGSGASLTNIPITALQNQITFHTGATNLPDRATTLLIHIGHAMPNVNYVPSVSFIGPALNTPVSASYSGLTTTNFTLNLSQPIPGGQNLRWSVIYSP